MNNKKKILTKENICSAIFAIIVLITVYAPYSSGSTLGNQQLRTVLKVILYVLTIINIFIVFLPIIKSKKVKDFNVISITPILLFVLVSSVHVYYDSRILSNIFIVIWITFCFAPNNIKVKSFSIFKMIFVVYCAFGILCYISYKLGLPLKYDIIPYYINNNSIYINYNVVWLQGSLQYPRLCCFYNEPGFFGTICALLLCASKLDLKKITNIIIFVAGVLSMSFAFAIILLVYLLINSWRNWKQFIVILLIIVFYVFFLSNIHTGNEQIDGFLQRFSITENGLEGDNRTNQEFDYAFENVMREKPLFGMGRGYKDSFITGVLSIKSYLADYGIIGCLLIYGSYIISAFYKNKYKSESLAFIVAFFLSSYQRPHIFNIQYQLILFGGILYLLEKNQKEKKIEQDN